jgi:hypothetical protein
MKTPEYTAPGVPNIMYNFFKYSKEWSLFQSIFPFDIHANFPK